MSVCILLNDLIREIEVDFCKSESALVLNIVANLSRSNK